jgi:hypothetical protein
MRFLVLIVLSCAACSSLPKPGQQPIIKPIADLPVEIRNHLPTVDVLVSGQPFKLFLDFGAFEQIGLTTEELTRTHVRFAKSSSKYINSSGEAFEAREFIAPNVVIGGVPFGDLQGGEFIHYPGGPPDKNGNIGMGLLGKYLLVLDYPNKHVRLYQSGDEAALQKECGTDTFSISVVNGVAQSVATTSNGKLLIEWDTGSTDTVLRPSAIPDSSKLGKQLDDGPPIFSVASIRLGDHEIGPVQFRLVQFAAPAVDGVFGTDLFASRRVCLDVLQQKGAIRAAF